MSRRIAIVGAGQSGLPLAISLLRRGHQVTLLSNRSAEQIRQGPVMSSQCMFASAVGIERAHDLDLWTGRCPPVEGIGLSVPHPASPGQKLIDFAARLEQPAFSVDQRLKMPVWMERFEQEGGRLVIGEAGIDELEDLAGSHELTVVASGKGRVGQLFERDAQRSPYASPQRALALTYVHGMQPRTPFSRVCFNLIPGVGEYFVFPALTLSGACEIMVFEGLPGGPMDCWAEVKSPQEHLARSLHLLDTFLPWEAQRCREVQLTDEQGILAGQVTPTVRQPVGRLPSGRLVLAMGDAVVLNDPITGQGSNSATRCFQFYLDAIVERETDEFDARWMQDTFDRYWSHAQHVVRWTNRLLAPPEDHVLALLTAAQDRPTIASEIVNNFDDPRRYFPWWFDAAEGHRFIGEHMAMAA